MFLFWLECDVKFSMRKVVGALYLKACFYAYFLSICRLSHTYDPRRIKYRGEPLIIQPYRYGPHIKLLVRGVASAKLSRTSIEIRPVVIS